MKKVKDIVSSIRNGAEKIYQGGYANPDDAYTTANKIIIDIDILATILENEGLM